MCEFTDISRTVQHSNVGAAWTYYSTIQFKILLAIKFYGGYGYIIIIVFVTRFVVDLKC